MKQKFIGFPNFFFEKMCFRGFQQMMWAFCDIFWLGGSLKFHFTELTE